MSTPVDRPPADTDPPRGLDGTSDALMPLTPTEDSGPEGAESEELARTLSGHQLTGYLDRPFISELTRYAYRHTRNYEDAEEVVQDALLKMVAAFHTVKRPTLETVKSFIYTTLHNGAIDRGRRNRTRRKYFQPEYADESGGADSYASLDPEPPEQTHFDAEDQQILAAFAAIPPASARAAVLKFLWDYSVKDIGLKLNIQPRTVSKHLEIARKVFKQHFLREGGTHEAQ